MKTWFKNLLSDGDAVSSKRFVGLLGAILLFTMFVLTSFNPKDVAASDGLVNAVLVLTLGCFGFTSFEKFTKK
jgi:hypothetical protein